jgi:hypothetical protein
LIDCGRYSWWALPTLHLHLDECVGFHSSTQPTDLNIRYQLSTNLRIHRSESDRRDVD